MTEPQQTWSIELLLLEDGSVSVRADEGKASAGCVRRVEQNPADMIRTLEAWLEDHDGRAITVVLRSPQAPIAVWTSPCASLALHRIASLFGNDWSPAFEVHEPPADASNDDPSTTGIRIRVSAEGAESGSRRKHGT
jgi:hypothetical protein